MVTVQCPMPNHFSLLLDACVIPNRVSFLKEQVLNKISSYMNEASWTIKLLLRHKLKLRSKPYFVSVLLEPTAATRTFQVHVSLTSQFPPPWTFFARKNIRSEKYLVGEMCFIGRNVRPSRTFRAQSKNYKYTLYF